MMTVVMDSSVQASSRGLAQRLFKKNIELENGLRKSAQSRTPSDPNAWLQMRENYEAIILEDYDFSEKHGIEYILWQLHYRRIEEFRARINAATSALSASSQNGKNPSRPDSVKKIRSVFKSFLSEATGFYHDLILKIRSKYGLPLGFFSDGLEGQTKDGKKSSEMKKGLFFCHRCLIYLGDLARYKGLYGEGDSISREYAAASSYYQQAASLWPSSGNPHHQLAILASYSSDELGAVYRYFRSLAVDSPFSKAKDNLIIAFEKNRQSCSQLLANTKVTAARTLPAQPTGSGRGKGREDTEHQAKDSKLETYPTNKSVVRNPETLKAFSTLFVRFNGILFTGTSMETFDEIFSSVMRNLGELLSSGPEEELGFGHDAVVNGLFLVRLATMLIFTVHNAKRDSDGQTYAEILQRTKLLQTAIMSAFQFVGYIVKRCVQLRDVTSSYLLPAILIFIEWLACHPDIAAGPDHEEEQSSAKSFFWSQFISFLNKLMQSGLVSSDGNEDDNCFVDMGRYDEGETNNRIALWEDFELRGFSPLVAAHVILDFSRKQAFGGDGSMLERKARLQRILAAGRALIDVVRIDQQGIYFDKTTKNFVIGVKPMSYDDHVGTSLTLTPEIKYAEEGLPVRSITDLGVSKPNPVSMEIATSKVHSHVEGEEEEEIVFKPMITEKYPKLNASSAPIFEIIQPPQISSVADWATYTAPLSATLSNSQMPTDPNFSSQLQSHAHVFQQSPGAYPSKWLMEQQAVLSQRINSLNLAGNGLQNGFNRFQPTYFSPQVSVPANLNNTGMSYNEMRVAEPVIPSKLDYVMHPGAVSSEDPSMRLSASFQMGPRKNPVSRPVRHRGPPPGFGHIPKLVDDSNSNLVRKDQYSQIDECRWQANMGMTSNNHAPLHVSTNNGTLTDFTSFPFPGKQVFTAQTRMNENLQNSQTFEQFKPLSDQQLQQANLQASILAEQHRAQSLWGSRDFV